MTEYVRVKDKETGHEYTVPERRFNADLMTRLDKSATNSAGDPLPVKPKTTASKEAAKKSGSSPKKSDTAEG